MFRKEKKTILLVDDDKEILDSLSSFLRRNGFDALSADTGAEGLKLARTQRPHLVILDLMLPDIDGSDVAVSLLQDPATRDIPIIFLTGVMTKAEQQKYGEIIANRCIVAKPCRPEEILTLIKERVGSAL